MSQDSDEWLYGGEWDYVNSSWVTKIRYLYDLGELHVGFKSGVVCSYDVSPQTAREMWEAPSHGQFVHTDLWHLSYQIV